MPVGLAGQVKFSVLLAIVYGVVKLADGGAAVTFVSSNSLIAPYAPLRGTIKGEGVEPPVKEMLRVSVIRVLELVDRLMLIVHVVGAASVPTQVLPVIVNGEPPLTVALENDTFPLPPMLTVTASALLTAGDVPVGMPKERLLGDTVSV